MFDFNPFISNDGSVGLYSKDDNDIYHSIYGALSESYEKFILPANLDHYLKKNRQLYFLDICYGIGYNTKSLIQFLINRLKENNSDNLTINEVDSIHTDKMFKMNAINNIDSIGTDKTHKGEISTNNDSIYTDKINLENIPANFDSIYADKIQVENSVNDDKISRHNSLKDFDSCFSNQNDCKKKFIIDSVDLNKNLILLSPFIKNKFDGKNILDIDIPEVNKNKQKLNYKKIKKEYEISNYVLELLLYKVFNSDFIDFNFLDNILGLKKYSSYFSKEIITLYKLLKYKQGINLPKGVLNRFLHNIYYRYLSSRYNKGLKCPVDNVFDINLAFCSAVDFLLTSHRSYDVVFLDAFTPAKCPKLWTVDFLKLVFDHLNDDGIVLTYSNSAQVRNAFLNAGFFVGKNFLHNSNKSYGTIAAKNKSLIKFPLSDFEAGLLNTRAGIFFKDENFSLSDSEIIDRHRADVENSSLISSSKYIKLNKDKNFIS